MPNYRRNYIAGGTYFFTVTLRDRRSHLLVEYIEALRSAVRKVKRSKPFHIDAWVVMPDHLHAMWTLPEGDADYSSRWREIKKLFTKSVSATERDAMPRLEGTQSVWQQRFWEHTIQNDDDYRHHFDYVHINPVKHGLVEKVADWPYSSFHRSVRSGIYSSDWSGDVADMVAGERV